MAAVTGVVDIVGGDSTAAGYEVVAVNIAGIAVAVVIFGREFHFALVYPHIGFQVGVVVVDTLVEYGHDDLAVTGGLFPSLLDLHIGILNRLDAVVFEEHIAVVDNVPLFAQQRVVHCATEGCAGSLSIDQRHSLAVVGAIDASVVINLLHLAQGRELLCHSLGALAIEAYHIPQVQTALTALLLGALVYGENPLQLVTAYGLQDFVYGGNTATSCATATAGDAFEHSLHLGGEFYNQLSLDIGSIARLLSLLPLGSGHIGEFVHTASQQKCCRNGQAHYNSTCLNHISNV